VRFSNDGGKTYRKVEAYLAYGVAERSPTQVSFGWSEGGGALKTVTHTYGATAGQDDSSWSLNAGSKVETKWVQFAVD